MKAIKATLITLIALLLTGCYTQLQYSQTMKKITDTPQKEAKEYAENEYEQPVQEPEVEEERAEQSQDEYSGYDEEEEYVPLYYKDYEYARNYDDCKCSPYNVYNFYGSAYDWYGYNYQPYYSFRSHLTISPFYYSRWHYRYRYFGHHYYRPGFAFSISWGHPYYSFYDPFYDPYYAFGFHYPISYNYYYFSGSYYSGTGGKVVTNRNTRYGPRSIGADRVVNNGDRSRSSRVSGRDAARVSSNKSTVQTRSRSVGTTRTRSVNRNSRSTVNRSRDRSSSNQATTRSRSRDNIQQDQSHDRVYIDRTDRSQRSVIIDRERAQAIRSRTINSSDNVVRRSRSLEDNSRNRFRRVELDRKIEQRRSQPTFFHRVRSFFKNNSGSFINNNDWGKSSRSRINHGRSTSTSRSSVGRSSSNSSRSSVTRSRSSSSSDSRSRGGSSRSRSGGDSSGGSDERSRGN